MYQQENTTATESSLNASKDASAVKRRICASLKDIYNRLRPPVISQRVFEDLSVCIVFQMLLFLANEHVKNVYFYVICLIVF